MRARVTWVLFLGWVATAMGASEGTQGPALYPRTDLNVVVSGIPLEPGMGLTSWMALLPLPPAKPGRIPEALALGRMVLLKEEIPGALKRLKQQGFQMEAHLGPYWGGSPLVERLYFSGRGPQERMAGALQALARSQPRIAKAPPPPKTSLTPSPTPSSLKVMEAVWSSIEGVLGPGTREGKLLSYVFLPGEAILKEGDELPASLGEGTEFHFQVAEGQVMGEKRLLGPEPKTLQPVVAVTGQFALRAWEVEPTRTLLAQRGVSLVAVEEHFKGETPQRTFLSFWAVGKPAELAKTLKDAWEKGGTLRPGPAPTPSP